MKLYCDMNVYNRCFDEQTQLRIRLESTAIEGIYAMAEAGLLTLTWSFVLEYENSLNPHADRKEWVQLLSRLCEDKIAPSSAILTLAGRVAKDGKLKPRDALHVACAEFAACDYFVTCDDVVIKRLARQIRILELKVEAINPVEFIRNEGGRYGKS